PGQNGDTMKATREDALSIWKAAVAAAGPFALVHDAVGELRSTTGRILVVGGGKAGAAMAAGAEAGLADVLDRCVGLLNVPEGGGRGGVESAQRQEQGGPCHGKNPPPPRPPRRQQPPHPGRRLWGDAATGPRPERPARGRGVVPAVGRRFGPVARASGGGVA